MVNSEIIVIPVTYETPPLYASIPLKTFFVLSSTASAHDWARSLQRKVLDLGPT